MIREFSSRVKPTNKKALYISLLSLTLFVASCAVYFSVEKYRGFVGLFALGFVTVTVLIYTKYVLAEYFYEIAYDSLGSPVFVVRQRVGKRDTTLCRIDLYSIVSITKQNKQDRASHKTPLGFVKYVYTPTLMPEQTYLITARTRYEKAEITIECPDEFASLLTSYSEEAKLNRKAEEDAEEY